MKSGSDVNPRERAKLMYLRSGCKKSLQIISKEIGVSLNTVKSWKRRDKWDDDPKAIPKGATATASATATATEDAPADAPKPKRKKGGQKGNKNAVHNRGGAPIGNRNAVTTGEYARLLFSDLSEEERALLMSVPECTVDLMRHDLALLCVREKRMLARIRALEASAENGMTYSEITRHHTEHVKQGNTDTTDTTDTTIAPVIDRIYDIDEALTRVRREKQRIINAINDYEIKQGMFNMEKDRHERQYGTGEDSGGVTIIYDYGDDQDGGGEE